MQRDYLKEYMDLAIEKCRKSRHRAQFHLDHFQNVQLVTVTIYDRMQTAWFVDGLPTFAYWLDQDQRQPYVEKMHKEGYTGARIAQMLGFSAATIYKDLKHIRETSPFRIQPRLEKKAIKKSKTIIPEGDWRMIALNAMHQKQNLRAHFKGAKSTMH